MMKKEPKTKEKEERQTAPGPPPPLLIYKLLSYTTKLNFIQADYLQTLPSNPLSTILYYVIYTTLRFLHLYCMANFQ